MRLEEGLEGVVLALLQDQLSRLFQQYHSLEYSQEHQLIQALPQVNIIAMGSGKRGIEIPFQSFGF
jgi:hypothetical protein